MHRVRFERHAGRAREDQQLAAHVFAREIDAGIGLGVTGGARFADECRERHAAVEAREQPRERSRQDTGDAMDRIATRLQRAQAAEQRQARADGRGIAVARTACEARLFDRLRTCERCAASQLVGGDDMPSAREPIGMALGDGVAGGRIEHDVRRRFAQ